ncbi:unnamed protein product [marine sediment metagenome]|uniref:Uncharacterized protein n=1 Tax=marine sediment metagenome TaxID=412755 RepID=X1RTU3_9ZZZZ
MKIGRYEIKFGKYVWFQTRVPTRIRHFLWFWFLKEARPTDVDKNQEFPTGTPMVYEGRRYRYWGPAPQDIDRGEVVFTTSLSDCDEEGK